MLLPISLLLIDTFTFDIIRMSPYIVEQESLGSESSSDSSVEYESSFDLLESLFYHRLLFPQDICEPENATTSILDDVGRTGGAKRQNINIIIKIKVRVLGCKKRL